MTGKELVEFARTKKGTPYVYGMKGKLLTQANYNYLRSTYGKRYVWDSDEAKVGKVCVDCSGLISWASGVMLGSAQLYEVATRRESIESIAKAPIGALVWMKGHVGIYTGMVKGIPYYIAADGSAYGVREVPISMNKFTHWLLVDLFTYDFEEDDEVVNVEVIIIDGKEHKVPMIRKDGNTYIKVRDLAELLNLKVGNKGKIPTLDK